MITLPGGDVGAVRGYDLGPEWQELLVCLELEYLLESAYEARSAGLTPRYVDAWHLLSLVDRCELLTERKYGEYASRLRSADLARELANQEEELL